MYDRHCLQDDKAADRTVFSFTCIQIQLAFVGLWPYLELWYRCSMFKYFFSVVILFVSLSSQAVQVIAHPTVELQQLNPAQLRALFSMRQTQWPDGSAVRVFVLSNDHPLHQSFCKEQLRMFPYQLDNIWNRLSFSGIGTRPYLAGSEQELVKLIQLTPGSIGYRSASADDTGVRIIEIL